MTSISPTSGRLLIKKIDRKDVTTESGLLMPGQTLQEENLVYGEIVKGNKDYKTGQRVFYSRYSATMVADQKGDQFHIVSDLDVMAVEDATS